MDRMDNPACIEARGLRFSYRGDPVLRQVDFTVRAGDFVAVIGANGAGKSTLLRLLLGEIAPDAGEIFLFDRPVERFRDWPRIGYVPQGGAGLAEGFPATAAEVAGMGLYRSIGPLRLPGREHRRRAREALAAVGMEDCADCLISRLSGGQMQRVLIARALAGNSDLLLLDEPVSGVDGDATLALYELLRRLRAEQGLTVVMVTHDVARAALYATRTLCLEQGSVVELDREQLDHELEHRHRHP